MEFKRLKEAEGGSLPTYFRISEIRQFFSDYERHSKSAIHKQAKTYLQSRYNQ